MKRHWLGTKIAQSVRFLTGHRNRLADAANHFPSKLNKIGFFIG
jgi:hypothetical protein